MKRLIFLLIILPLAFSFIMCGRGATSYTEEQGMLIENWINMQFGTALAQSDEFMVSVIEDNEQDYFIALLEHAKIAMAAKNYDTAITDFQEAEERFWNIEGTVDIGGETSSLFTNDSSEEYEPEDYEKLMIGPYLVLSYLGNNDFEGARVEKRRAIVRINELINSRGEDFEYLENAFSRTMIALMYEKEGVLDDVEIEYRQIGNIGSYFQQFADKQNEMVAANTGEALGVFVDVGLSPWKIQVDSGDPVAIEVPEVGTAYIKFAYASVQPRAYSTKSCRILLNGQSYGETELLYDIESIAIEQHEKNAGAIFASVLARATTKAIVQLTAQYAMREGGSALFGSEVGALMGAAAELGSAVYSAIEFADLRSWLTLPAQVQYLRVNDLAPGTYTVELEYLDAGGNVIGRTSSKNALTVDIAGGSKVNFAHFTVPK